MAPPRGPRGPRGLVKAWQEGRKGAWAKKRETACGGGPEVGCLEGEGKDAGKTLGTGRPSRVRDFDRDPCKDGEGNETQDGTRGKPAHPSQKLGEGSVKGGSGPAF